ncbi:MAG: TonB-dependent receptor [Cellvibrionaceae bacterium]|nr:TonB-dependent receptor [Cellvibrionaceae bacterium]
MANAAENPPILETVYVEGEKNKLELEKEQSFTPGGVTLLDQESLRQRNMSSLADMLRYVPGVWVASGSTGDSAFFSSRGSNLDATNYDGNGIKLLQDGLPVTAADGNNHNRAVDPLSTRYAIVARGANALTYGASTLGGAIDFISPTAHDTEPEVFLNGGSHGQIQGRITGGVVAGEFDGLITLEARQWDGFRDAQHAQERAGIYINAGWQFSDAVRTRFYATYLANDQELPGALTEEEFADDPHQAQAAAVTGNYQYNVETWRVANKTVWDISTDSSLTVGFSYEEQALYHPIVYSPFFSLLIDTDQNNFGTSLRYKLNLGNHNLLAGLNYGETSVEGGNYSHQAGIRTDLMTLVDNEADSLEIFLVDRWQIAARWNLIYGIQAVSASREVRNINTTTNELYNPKGDYDSVNPRIGVIYQLTKDIELFTNLSRLYEAPTNYELEDDVVQGLDTKPLDAMHGTVFEVGTRGNQSLSVNNHWYWELAVYYAQLQEEILSVDNPGAPGTSLSSNVDDTIHAGVEVLVGASLALGTSNAHRLEPLVNVTINEFSFDSDPLYGDNQLPVAPGYAIKGEILYRNASGFFAGPTFDLVDERYVDFSNTHKVDSYTLLGLRTGFASSNWEVYGEARNLTDEEYVGVFSVKDRFIPVDPSIPTPAIFQSGEPRSFYVGVKIQF